MDPRRIEEIRRKLREGRKVYVRAGKLAVDGVPAGQTGAAAGTAQGAADTPAPEGVLVKPHEWGTAAAEELPFYTTAAGETRALQEQALLWRGYPGCLDHSGAFTKKSTLITLLAWVSVWLVF
jgi:hypothetical protein